ncbi:MAG: M1 family aminopeptidase, partial [Planctomycetota bacterium]
VKGCWHPKAVRRVDGDWHIGIEEFAQYRVSIGLLAQSLIPASGASVRRQEDEDGLWTVTYEASNIPDFSMVFSHADHVLSGTDGDVKINVFYLRDKDVAERMLNIAKDVIGFYRKMYGFYPDKILNIIAFDGQGFGGGPLGSNTVHVNKTFKRSEDGTIWAVAHEIGHEYWGWNWVIDSNPRASWLCLGMGLWSDLQYMEAQDRGGQNANIQYDYLDAAKRGLNTKLENPAEKDLQNRMDESSLAHSKGYNIALMLEYLVGKDTFHKIAKRTLERFAHQTVTTQNFQSVCEEVFEQELDWFFHQWVYTNDTLDYAVVDVKPSQEGSKQQIVVSIEAVGSALMPVDVLLEFADGSIVSRHVPRNERSCIFTSDKVWRRVILDPNNCLPDRNISDNITINPQIAAAFEILDVDLGDKAWGLNQLRVHVKNTSNQQRLLKVHIGAGKRRVPSGCGFGMGKNYMIAPYDDCWIEHWYFIPPGHGVVDAIVTLRDLVGQRSNDKLTPFLTKNFEINFPIPNDRCNNLTITEKLPVFKKFYKGVKHLGPFEHFITDHFVFYCSPNTPAHNDIKSLMGQRESGLKKVCDFANITPAEVVIVFFYPDQTTKRMCTMHTGNGLARGNMIAEVYNDQVKLDPYHETTHVLMRQYGDPPALFNEGFAVYMSERLGAHALDDLGGGQATIYQRVRELKAKGELIDLRKLLGYTEIGSGKTDPPVAYPEAASFVKFLIDQHGKDKFLQAYRTLRNSDDTAGQEENISTLEQIYGTSLAELEKQWEKAFSS